MPISVVATEIVPPPPIVNVGVVRVICPAFPVLDAVLNNPLHAPEIDRSWSP